MMDVSCGASLLLAPSPFLVHTLPQEILQILRRGSNAQYLDILSRLALDPAHTITIFTSNEPLAVEICGRWLPAPETDDLSALAALARILPSAPYLSVYATYLLKRGRGVLASLTSQSVTALDDLPWGKLEKLLLALCRLLRFDNKTFASSVYPAQLQVLLHHVNPGIRYLAIRIFCMYLYASDAALNTMISTYIGEGEIAGRWEDKTIDYTFFSLWEEKRLKDLAHCFQMSRNALSQAENDNYKITERREIEVQDLSVTVACIGGVLVPRLDGKDVALSSLIMTETTSRNVRLIADGLLSSRPLLVTGPTGAGKTSVIRDMARELGKGSSMITLHLNEQTDAKLLIGMYTSAKTPGSFSWRPGVLTTAVMEGRWVVIEDLDRAPTEILSTLLPLLERRELLVPNWGETIRAAPGFKLIATVRSTLNTRENTTVSTTGMMGLRHWLRIDFSIPADEEFTKIIMSKFPLLRAIIPQLMDVYQTLKHQNPQGLSRSVTDSVRQIGPQDLLRWCSRVQDLLSGAGITSGNEPISDAISDYVFLEAVDCFVGSCPPGTQKSRWIDIIAQNLYMPAERVIYCLNSRKPEYKVSEVKLKLGRVVLKKQKKPIGFKSNFDSGNSPFATTNHVARLLESVAAAVKQAEPCLLVGETGTGKTTIIQRLADAVDQRLTVINLSQQSETGDLLGGYKPLNMRALAVPMKEEFDELLGLTAPTSKKNQSYVEALAKLITKGRWSQVLVLWQNALRMVDDHLKPGGSEMTDANEEHPSKRRKLKSPRLRKLKSRWDKFASDVQVFQNHLASGSKGFAFSFVESNLVKAARNGEWVLLDEINLASPATLESLADLFSPTTDGGPSIFLTETGDTERVQAHESFRIFAAMNPATDIGKRNLPPNLRSKFSELFVEAPDKDLEDLVSVVKTYLGGHGHADVRACIDIARLYLDIQKLTAENRLVDGANQNPHFSFRTLTRTLIYILDVAPMYGLRRAMFEGFSMSFLTVLNKESELLLQPLLMKHIFGEQRNSKSSLYQNPCLPSDGRSYVHFKHYYIAQGANSIQEQSHYIITPFIEHNLLSLVRATSTRRFPVLLQGPTSSGKTSMVEHLARLSGNKFVRINNHEHTDLQEYLGTYVSGPDGRLKYQDGVLVRALREGHWVVLDELNLAPTDVLEALNRLLDDNKELLIPETQQVVRPHKNFMLFATQNPPGMYGGRKVLSRAFRNRFLELHFDDIPENELETILRERSQIAPSFCTRIVAVYKKLSILRQSDRLFEQRNSFATLRDLFRWALRKADDREQLGINGYLLLAERVRNPEERLAIKAIIEEVMKIGIDEEKIYGSSVIEKLLHAQHPSSHNIVWTKSMRRLCILVTEALKNHEPVLLVGETGSGKTTICQFMAEMTGTNLHIVNAHQNLETGDLIGAQRPVRNKAHVELQLSRELIAILKHCNAWGEDQAYDIPELLRAYDNLSQEARWSLTEQQRLAIENGRVKFNSLFEWADGSLVAAMRDGEHFLLDEISLADDSVLERLNTVLEPGRTLLLAEKVTSDEPVKAAPGFQFLATMNPGGDFGKRELSPALRNRFTEIWVPNTSSEDEMLEIIHAKLLPRFSIFSKPMVAFAAWYSATYNTSTPYISIRDILSWVQFVNNFQCPDMYASLLHGAAMVFVDGLGANVASKSSIAESSITEERVRCISKLDGIFCYDMSSIYHEAHRIRSDAETFGVGPFSLSRPPEASQDSRYSLKAPTTMANAMRTIRALQLKKPILIEGSPGVGKTTLVAALAHAIGMPLTRINLSDQTDLMDLFGSDVPVEGVGVGHFAWRDAPFLRAMQRGEWVLLDEMNLASQSVLEGLNACLDHRGQVYISELDRVFAKHPDFVVFAAQNPYSQGGGRKGLPASFVNRFTVVYADIYTPEDLLQISTEIYPAASDGDRTRIVHTVTEINRMLHENRSFGAQGGPWEINLRDVLRWLRLLTARSGLLPFAGSAQYAQLLLLQRFRTPEDVTAISKILECELPQEQCHSYYHGKCESLFEIGLGLLPRDCKSQPIASNTFDASKTNLAIAESAMLCVQNCWPCLLVGPSGSGKSNLIFQLAYLAGADVVEIPFNPEMDTMDLVGGFEQTDPQREVFSFMKRLREHTRRIMIGELETEEGLSDELIILEAQFHAPEPSLVAVVQSIEDMSGMSRFKDFLAEGQKLLRKAKIDNRARFEWIDGILVKALKQGKWVVLDNANLCNPSVLDRLNSLLEPNGFLSINENRTPGGSAEVVHPNKNFRLFLTMDPRHGELSRAMRNRSIELFLPANHPSPSFEILGSAYESSISRFGLFQKFDWNGDDKRYRCMLTFLLDHLSLSDFAKCSRWEAQIRNGLMGKFDGQTEFLFSLVMKTYRWVLDRNGRILRGISDVYESIETEMSLSPSGFASMQAIHPLNNAHLLASTDQNTPQSNLPWLGDCLDLLLSIYGYLQDLMSIDQRLYLEGETCPWTALERSMISLRGGSFHDDATQPIASLLQDMGLWLRSRMEGEDLMEVEDREGTLIFIRDTITYLRDMLDLAHSQNFDVAVFQIYQAIGRSLVARINTDGKSEELSASLARELTSKLDTFNSSWQLSSGTGMEKLWIAFKPNTAINLSQLTDSLLVKGLADQYDTLRFISSASVRELEQLQKSLVQIHDSIVEGDSQDKNPLTNIQEILGGLQSRFNTSKTGSMPYFKSEFEACYQHSIQTATTALEHPSMLRTLGGRSTRQLMEFGSNSEGWKLLSQMQQMAITVDPKMSLASIRGILPISILQKLARISGVPLRSLELLHTEFQVIAQSVANLAETIQPNPLDDFLQLLRQLQGKLRQTLGSLDRADIRPSVTQLFRQSGENSGDQPFLDRRVEYLCLCLQSTTNIQTFEAPPISAQKREEYAKAATGCLTFFTGCLLLFVPDRPFDPALRPIVERTRHSKRRGELELKLGTLRDIEKVFSGQESNYRIQGVEKDLQALGAEPRVPSVARPQTSELNSMQTDFNNILKTIITRSPDVAMLQSSFEGQQSQIQEIKLMRANIAQVVERLTCNYHAYEDITRPLVAMLQGLSVGLNFAQLASPQSSSHDEIMKCVAETTPLLAAAPASLTPMALANLQTVRIDQFDLRIHFLEVAAVMWSGGFNSGSTSPNLVFQIFHNLYEEWKAQLDEGQKQNAARSSLYRYRGSEAENDEDEEQEFCHLFPTSEHPSEDNGITSSKYDPRQQAQRLAQLQRNLFQNTKPTSERILCLLLNASQNIAGFWQNESSMEESPVPAEHMLPALILSLSDRKELLDGMAVNKQQYNFYTHANLSEALRLTQLVYKIQARFTELQEAWPEHTTLGDVMRISSELLAFRHTEPVAKLLTKAEQLHGYLHEWQVVASKQFTAVKLYDQLTELLVSWRRLELATWARLLDMEDQKCHDDADAWWFVAYEVIIAAPLSLVNNGEDVRIHTEQMFTTLSDFLTTASMGQYAPHLRMITCFQSYLELLERHYPAMSVVRNAIKNFISYYSRFKAPIQQSLRSGRQALETDMKEILLLASWKDTNINALRDSAKRSHHKLFKVIRKYRTLLAKPSDSIIGQGISQKAGLADPSATPVQPAEPAPVDVRAVQICQRHLSSWKSKPERFTNAASTAQRMISMSKLPPTAMDVTAYLTGFSNDLTDSIKTLRKETPLTATKENVELLKHLKVRKRKLYVDTLKAVRQMGFRYNISADVLAGQASLALILTNSASIPSGPYNDDINAAEGHFHTLLDILPKAKERARNHAEDLTHGEVARSVGYLENMLSMILKQRFVVASAIAELETFVTMAGRLQNLWAPDSYSVGKWDLGQAATTERLQNVLGWLPTIIEAGSVIIEKHGKLGCTDPSAILGDLGTWKENILASLRTFDSLPDLPRNLISSQHEQATCDAQRLLQQFKAHVQLLIKENPGLRFVLNQIQLWTNTKSPSVDQDVEAQQTTFDLEIFDDRVSSMVDSILVAVQHAQEASLSISTSDNGSAWLSDIEKSLSGGPKSTFEVNKMLKDTVSKLEHPGDKKDRELRVAAALCNTVMPILQQYHHIQKAAFIRYLQIHRSLCELTSLLASIFTDISHNGFCTPVDNSNADAGEAEKLEGGTGLGEGEGAEDISKDIQDDEDLSELAQERNKDGGKEDVETHEDAVDMDHDDLEGEMGDGSDKGEDDGSASEGDEKDIDEQTGNVDDLDPSAVDEKLWDGKAEDSDKDKEGSKAKGKAETDEQVAAESAGQKEADAERGDESKDEVNEEGAEENEEIVKEETEMVNSHASEGQNLDLPEEMELDNIDDKHSEQDSENSDMDGISDVHKEQMGEDGVDQQDHEVKGEDLDEAAASPQTQPEPNEGDANVDSQDSAESPVDTEPSDEGQEVDDQGVLQDRSDDAAVDPDNAAPSDVRGLGEDTDEQDVIEQASSNQDQASKGDKAGVSDRDESNAVVKDGELGQSKDRSKENQPHGSAEAESGSSQAFKKLGDALEEWHRLNKEIKDAADQDANRQPPVKENDMTEGQFEHLRDGDMKWDTQALGAAAEDQARPLDNQALDAELPDETRVFPPEELNKDGGNDNDQIMDDVDAVMNDSEMQQGQSRPTAFVADAAARRLQEQQSVADIDNEEDIKDINIDLSSTHLHPASTTALRTASEAHRLWLHHESVTRPLSLTLTEQLRLILSPTHATKMRGDFRTGKRLNIKRIIPYIASNYKRDNIWMRRTIPSKRNYQIMLALDDSKSMLESGGAQLAFSSLALVAKSLSMLEVGEICVVGFGNEVHVAHEFGKPFTSDAGAQCFQTFSFNQTKTNVRQLIAESISLFRTAKARSHNPGTDLWQLELIISDGVCEDHEGIRRLVRQAQDEHIMIVFVIVDAVAKAVGEGKGKGKGESILDMSEAVFEADETGETKLRMKRYLDGFPFGYYVVVGDVRDLPGVLGQALRGWFREVVESG